MHCKSSIMCSSSSSSRKNYYSCSTLFLWTITYTALVATLLSSLQYFRVVVVVHAFLASQPAQYTTITLEGRRNILPKRWKQYQQQQQQQQQSSPKPFCRQTTTFQSSVSSSDDQNTPNNNNSIKKTFLQELNPSQHEAVTQPIPSITRVIAGPGAGKTKVLTSRIAYLLEHDDDDDDNSRGKVLAVTFTKKAAMEMQHRLQRLFADTEEQEEKGEEEEEEGEEGEIYQEEYNTSPLQRRKKSHSKMDRVTLGTFHSICAKLLRWYGNELSSLPSLSSSSSSLMTKKKEEEEVTSLNGNFIIIDQSDQLKLIKECLTTLKIDLSQNKDNKRRGGDNNNNLRPITILNAVSQLKAQHRSSLFQPPPQSEQQQQQQEQQEEQTRKMSKKLTSIATQVYPLYNSHLLSQNTLDFDDLIHYSRELLYYNPAICQAVQKRWRHVLVDEFQDTSTSQLELVKLWTIKNRKKQEEEEEEEASSSLLVVGDGNQSIYSWRGANVGSMERFVEEFEGVNTVYLMENYRSTSNIIKAAQKVITASPSSSAFMDEVRQDIMKPMRGSGPTPRILACSDAKAEASFVVKTILEMTSTNDLTPQSTIAILYRTNAQSRAIEEACVSENLHYLIRGSAGTFYSRAEVKDCLCFLKLLYNGRDRVAFVRAVKTPSRGIGDVALEEFWRYWEELDGRRGEGGRSVTLLDALISLAKEDEKDSSNDQSSSIVSPQQFISKRALNRFIPFAKQMKKIRKQAYTQTVSELLTTIMSDLDLRSHFDSISKTSDEFAERLGNAMELCAAAERYSEDGPCLVRPSVTSQRKEEEEEGGEDVPISESPLGNFLDDVSLLVDADGGDSEQSNEGDGPGRVVANLMTIHASKGMEFDAVFLIGNEEGTFPTQRSIVEGEGSVELEEERRLCYVAMTRAKTNLVLTWRREVMTFFGQGFKIKDTDRSRFLDTLVSKKVKKTKKKKVLVKTKKKTKLGNSEGQDSGVTNLTLEQRRQQLRSKMSNVDVENALPKSPQGGSWEEWKPAATINRERQKQPRQDQRRRQDDRMKRQPATKRTQQSLSSRSSLPKSPQRGSWAEWKPSTTNGNRVQNRCSAPPPSQQQYSSYSKQRPQQEDWRSKKESFRQHPAASTRRPAQRQQQRPSQAGSRVQTPRGDEVSFDNFLKDSSKSPAASGGGSGGSNEEVPQVDSTLFYAVGSSIRHSIHGRGTVLPPPKEDNMLVRVRFDSEMEIDFPITGSGLQHINK